MFGDCVRGQDTFILGPQVVKRKERHLLSFAFGRFWTRREGVGLFIKSSIFFLLPRRVIFFSFRDEFYFDFDSLSILIILTMTIFLPFSAAYFAVKGKGNTWQFVLLSNGVKKEGQKEGEERRGKLPKPKWKSRRKISRPRRRHLNSVDRKDHRPRSRWRCRAAINDTSPHYCMVIGLWCMFGHSDNTWSGWPSSPFFVFAREIWSSSWKDEMYKEVDCNFSSSHLTETEWDVRVRL